MIYCRICARQADAMNASRADLDSLQSKLKAAILNHAVSLHG
jgi:hypothetical protein